MDKDMMESVDKNNHFNRVDMIQPKPDMITPIDKADMIQPMPDKNNHFNRADMIQPIPDKNNYFNRADMMQPEFDIYQQEDEQTVHKRR